MDAARHLDETRSSGIRHDYLTKVTGEARFASDIVVPGMLQGRILRSPLPHARIRSIDVSAALAIPGVVAVLTGTDLAGMNSNWGMYLRDRPIIAVDKVRYVGDPVAAVAAVDEFTAEEALELIRVDYEPLPFVTDAEEAMKAGAPLIHERMETQKDFYVKGETRPTADSNIFQSHSYAHGDVDAAFASAYRVHEDRFVFPMVLHAAMEPHVVIADMSDSAGTIWTCGQSLAAVQKVIAQLFGIQLARIRVISAYVGGGFGGKAFVKLDPLVAALSWKARRPVRVCLSMSESMLMARRLNGVIELKTAVTRDGRLSAKQIRVVLNGGAYSDTGPIVAVKAAIRAIGPYRLPNLKLEAYGVYTNTIPGAAFRSIGGPQGVWASESQMDIIADALKLDPIAFRLSNMVNKGEHIRPDLRPLDVDMPDMLRRAVAAFDRAAPDGTIRGVAVGATDPGIMPLAAAMVRLKVDGSVLIFANTIELGQGGHGVMRSIAARTLEQPLERVVFAMPDSDIAPFDWGTGGSRSTVVMGKAVELACADIAQQVAALAAEVLGGKPEQYRFAQGGLVGPSGSITIAALTYRAWGIESGEYVGIGRVTPRSPGMSPPPLFWETSAGVGEIDVDAETGEIRLLRYVSAADCGRALSRESAEGQDEGAATMGLGHALFEEVIYEDGQPLNASLIDYRMPTTVDAPKSFQTLLIESGDGPGPFGSRGMGEGAILPMAPVIANALFQRHRVRIRELPLTPERVWRALKEAREAEAASVDASASGRRGLFERVRARFRRSDVAGPKPSGAAAAPLAFAIEMSVPGTPAQVWPIFFDLPRIAALIPGCSDVKEVRPLASYAAVMRQRIGPFKVEVPTEIRVETLTAPAALRARAIGFDKYTGTRVETLLDVRLEAEGLDRTTISVDTSTQVAGRLASLGYPLIKKRSMELFAVFEARLREELERADVARTI